jgi:hypothetical protein
MEGQKGRLLNSTRHTVSGAANKLADGLINVGEAMISTREISLREGLSIGLCVFAGMLGIGAVVGAFNREFGAAAGEAAIAGVIAATGTIIYRSRPHPIDNQPPQQ